MPLDEPVRPPSLRSRIIRPYDGAVSASDDQQPRGPEPRWEQPGWSQASRSTPRPADPEPTFPDEVLTGSPIVARRTPQPPSVIESTLRVFGGVVWPLAIVASIFQVGGGWVFNLAGAFLITAATGAITAELRRRRRARF